MFVNKFFLTKSDLNTHTKIDHSNDGDWRCDGCSFLTNTEEILKNHMILTKNHSQQIKDTIENQTIEINCNFRNSKFETTMQMMTNRAKISLIVIMRRNASLIMNSLMKKPSYAMSVVKSLTL